MLEPFVALKAASAKVRSREYQGGTFTVFARRKIWVHRVPPPSWYCAAKDPLRICGRARPLLLQMMPSRKSPPRMCKYVLAMVTLAPGVIQNEVLSNSRTNGPSIGSREAPSSRTKPAG